MTRPASVGGHESRRLFCALTLPDTVRAALMAWQRELPRGDARPVAAAKLHITLAFLGSRPERDVARVADALRASAGALDELPLLRPLRYRETRSVGMLVLDDEDGRAGRLADDLHGRLEQLGVYTREARPWLPHLTVLRFRRQPRLSPGLPGIAPFSPSEAAVYHSLLRRGGAEYDVLASMSLGG